VVFLSLFKAIPLWELLTAEYADFADLTLILFGIYQISVKSAKSAYSAVLKSQSENCCPI
jgi:hypothetical protein